MARAQHNDIDLSLTETMPSGARAELVTDVTCIELDASAGSASRRGR
ncbi:MAG: hypothetical protein AVDCRST_MAG50-227 [uncultured Acidimicrobiales bacterium]|uniref:Uncharacterized protein n=1 Tax=uncultured Acidimicrobiales bacterium TaxID=310071 RepID=A0A6J4H813_9ACTN|nr:MAG: hypothetical protein AVDCRST_MAG50-227 [uncultured Acidimicrobiales bacterium]